MISITGYLSVAGPHFTRYSMYNLVVQACDSRKELDITKIDRSRMYYAATSFKSTVSSLFGSLNREITKEHERILKTEDGDKVDPFWRRAPLIKVGEPEYIMVRKRRNEIIKVLHNREIEFGITGRKGKERLLGPQSIMMLYQNLDFLLDGNPSPIVCILFTFVYVILGLICIRYISMYQLSQHLIPITIIPTPDINNNYPNT